MQSGSKMFTVDRFLGINEAPDGNTELKMGEASKMENFLITDGFNLTVRPGLQRLTLENREPAPILGSWAGFIDEESNQDYLVIVDFYNGKDRIWLWMRTGMERKAMLYSQEGALGLTEEDNHMVKIFAFGGRLWITSRANTVSYKDGQFQKEEPYVPLVIAGATPSGGGSTLEGINLLTSLRRVTYSADGESKTYVLPEEAEAVVTVTVDNVVTENAGSFDKENHSFTFNTAPVKGVGNVEITYDTEHAVTAETREMILAMPLVEAYNGSTDTRLFVGGNGNICYYTGITQQGKATPMYFPAMNQVAVDMTGSGVTGLVRHYGKLLVFTRDGTYTLSYEPVTNADGTTTAGFYLRGANREFGNDVPGQVCTVNNYPRTISGSGIYEWRITSSYYQDERYAKRVSDKVQHTLKSTDVSRIIACDDDREKTYYLFLNDDKGTVLVSRYDLAKEDIWCVYRGNLFRDVRNAFVFDGDLCIVNDREVFCFRQDLTVDAPVTEGDPVSAIRAEWESGYMDFGADFRRKFSSQIYVSMLPQAFSEMMITARTDRRSDHMEKTVTSNVFAWGKTGFPNWTFNTNAAPKIQKVRLKVKKFVYYQLLFRVEKEGATATVLGYDQEIRFGSMAK